MTSDVHAIAAVTVLLSLPYSRAAVSSEGNPDVQWVNTSIIGARKVLEWARVGTGDIFYELGCGDGVVAREALKRGAATVCVERDPELAATAEELLRNTGGAGKAPYEVLTKDLFKIDLSQATVIFLFLLPEINALLLPILRKRAPKLRMLLSHNFEVWGLPCGTRLRVPVGDGKEELFLGWSNLYAAWDPKSIDPKDQEKITEHASECLVFEEHMKDWDGTWEESKEEL